ncbi:MAG: CpsD/CapB family tyrosine-protein kinase, partial [Planctomycetota bacterium]
VEKLTAQERHLSRRLEDQMAVVTGLREKLLRLRKSEGRISVLRLQIERLSDTLQALISKRHDMEIEMPNETNNVSLHGPAEALTRPYPNRLRLMVMGVLGGLALGVLVVVSLTVLDTTVRTPADVEAALSTRVLGFVANMEDQATDFTSRCLVTRKAPRSAPSESFREVRARLIASLRDEAFRTLLITSTNPREGKTTVAVNLAISLAQSGRRVLLVDATLRHPNLHLVFDLDQSPGFSSVLADEVPIDRAVHDTTVDNLQVVPGGAEPESPSELFSTQRAAEVVEQLAGRADIVLLDCAPVLGVSDTIALSAHVDAALFVVKSAGTQRSVVARARQSVDGSGIPVIGAVINDVRYTRGDYYYYARHY